MGWVAQQAEEGSQGVPSRLRPPPHLLCSPHALPQCPGPIELTLGGSQEESEEHRPPALAAGLWDWGEAHVTLGPCGARLGQKRSCGSAGEVLVAGSRHTRQSRKPPGRVSEVRSAGEPGSESCQRRRDACSAPRPSAPPGGRRWHCLKGPAGGASADLHQRGTRQCPGKAAPLALHLKAFSTLLPSSLQRFSIFAQPEKYNSVYFSVIIMDWVCSYPPSLESSGATGRYPTSSSPAQPGPAQGLVCGRHSWL